MKLKLWALALALAFSALLAGAQSALNGSTYNWTAVSGTGQLGNYLWVGAAEPPAFYSIDWVTSGTAPSACTFRIEGSSDAVNWTGLDATSPAADSVPCTSTNLVSIAYKPVRYLRVNVVSYTAGDGTTQVVFHYTMGR